MISSRGRLVVWTPALGIIDSRTGTLSMTTGEGRGPVVLLDVEWMPDDRTPIRPALKHPTKVELRFYADDSPTDLPTVTWPVRNLVNPGDTIRLHPLA